MTARCTLILVAATSLLLACRGGEPGATWFVPPTPDDHGGGGSDGGGSDVGDDVDVPEGPGPAPSLACPDPGALPFSTEASALSSADAQTLVESQTRVKDSGADYLGNPGGPGALTDQPQEDPLLDGSVQPVSGRMARSPVELGLGGDPIVGEWVSTWRPLEGPDWSQIGRVETDEEGTFRFELSGDDLFGQGSHVLYSILEGTGTCVEHGYFLWPAGTKMIITDIDGTLTLSDEELLLQIQDGSYDPKSNAAATELVNAWVDKGYKAVYLTARPHAFRAETRAWLADKGFPRGPIITANSLVFSESARVYKSTWVSRLRDAYGWEILAAYGNATSDIDAYEDAGIPKTMTFIIGPEAGKSSTTPVDNNDWGPHIVDFVQPQPDVDQPW